MPCSRKVHTDNLNVNLEFKSEVLQIHLEFFLMSSVGGYKCLFICFFLGQVGK